MAGGMIDAPFKGGQAVVVGTDFDRVSNALFVGTGGDLTVITRDGSTLTFKNVVSGSWIPGRIIQVSAVVGAADINAVWS